MRLEPKKAPRRAGAACVPGVFRGLTGSGDGISSSGRPVAVFGFGATSTSGSDDSLLAVCIELAGEGFSRDDLAALSTDGAVSGVAIYRDDGSADDLLDSLDTPLQVNEAYWEKNSAHLKPDAGEEEVPTGLAPSGWVNRSRAPGVLVSVLDLTSGVAPGSAWYRFSKDGGTSWSGWEAAFLGEENLSTGYRTVIATDVPFGVDSADRDLVEFMACDIAGNIGRSGGRRALVDDTGPGDWVGLSPSGWTLATRTPTMTVSVRDLVSGLRAGSARYRYSVDGGESWGDWTAASQSGPDAANAFQTIEARKVPFGQDSARLNLIQFLVADVAGNIAESPEYSVRIDTAPPGRWEALEPSGWQNRSDLMTVTVRCREECSGLLQGSAKFQVSTDGGLGWSPWTPAQTSEAGGAGAWSLTAWYPIVEGDEGGFFLVRFWVSDRAGNTGASDEFLARVDASPPGGWADMAPAGWCASSTAPTVTVRVGDPVSGLDLHGAGYRFTKNGGTTWSAWRPASLSGWSGSSGLQTLTAPDVPFGRDSGTLNRIQFRCRDLAGNVGESGEYPVRIDTTAPLAYLRALRPWTPGGPVPLAVEVEVVDGGSAADASGPARAAFLGGAVAGSAAAAGLVALWRRRRGSRRP